MAPFFNTKSIALFVIFFLAIASSEASRGINPAATTTPAMTDINDLFSSVVLGQNAPLRDYNPDGDLNRTMNITVKCLQSILDFTICTDYFHDETIPAPPEICCDGYMALTQSLPCICQLLNSGWSRELPKPIYLPHVFAAPTLCGIPQRTTPFPGCDAYMPHPTPSPAPAPAAASPATSPSPVMSP